MLLNGVALRVTTLREQGIATVHDQVVSLVAQRWAKAFHCKVTIHTDLEQNPWADPDQQCDIIGWYVSSGGNTMEWMAEVETAASLADTQTAATLEASRRARRSLLPARASRLQGRSSEVIGRRIHCFQLHLRIPFLNDMCHVL